MLNETTKKILKVSLFVIVVIALAWAIYFVFFHSATTVTPVDLGLQTALPTNQAGQLPSSVIGNVNQEAGTSVNGTINSKNNLLPEGQIVPGAEVQVLNTERAVYGQVVAAKATVNGVNYYSPTDNHFYSLTSAGDSQKLSAVPFYNVAKTTWSNDGSRAVLEYPDGANIVYDFNTQKQYTLPKELRDFSFFSNGAELAAKAIGDRPENNWLVTANFDGSGIKFVEPMGENSDKVEVNISPNGQVIALYPKNTGADDQEVLLIGRNQENFYSLKTLGRGFTGEWTPDGDKLLYSVYSSDNGFRPTLWIVDAQGDNIGLNNKKLSINTWPAKCVFADNQTVYCAAPQNLPEGSGIYPEMAKGLIDDFYKIDLKTGSAVKLNTDPWYSVKSLTLSPDKKSLYAEDAESGSLLKISL